MHIDLQGIHTKEQLLSKIGEVFELGGPDGNIPVEAGSNKGWGMNYDALHDSLGCLEEGGIWGTSKKFTFPLKVTFANAGAYKSEHPEDFKTLIEIFKSVSQKYEADGADVKAVVEGLF